jgi:hypothetical protein
MRNDFRAHLSMLDDDDLADVTTAVSRERARRSQRPVAEMNEREYQAWADAEIAKAQAAKAKEGSDHGEG